MSFWKDKNKYMRKAEAQIADMNTRYFGEIAESIRETKTYGPNKVRRPSTSETNPYAQIMVVDEDSISAAYHYGMGRTCILNFASYMNPGGGFVNGAWAQEEALCHESALYNVLAAHESYYLWNRDNVRNHLYKNRALYSPNVVFEHNYQTKYFDVLTCAAPKLSEAFRCEKVSEADNTKALTSRINFIFDILAKHEVDVVILGAWGCGVFKQNPEEVASLFSQSIENGANTCERIVFAIPGGPNLAAFQKVFE